MSDFINTIDALGDDVVFDSIIDRSIVEFYDDIITTIGEKAFYGCDKLTRIALPNVTGWTGHYQTAGAFQGCTALTELTDEQFPLLTTLTASAFRGCTGVKIVSLTNVEDLSWYGLADCKPDVVNLPNLRTIGMNGGFAGSSNLKCLVFPSLTFINNYGFEGYPHLECFDCGSASEGPLEIKGATRVFNTATGLKAFVLRHGAVAILSEDCLTNTPIASGTGYIYVPASLIDSYQKADKWSTYYYQFRPLFNKEEINQGIINETLITLIDDEIELIPKFGFNKYAPITTVNMQNCTSVGDYAFYCCGALESIDLPLVTYIGRNAFDQCSALRSINLPQLTQTGANTFAKCTELEEAHLPNVKKMGTSAGGGFSGCSKLAIVDAPSLQEIQYACFSGTALTNVIFPSATSVGNLAFAGCKSLRIIDLPVVTALANGVFQNASVLTAVILRNQTGVCTLGNTVAFAGTPIESGAGYIYVPGSLVSRYINADNWSTYAEQFRGLFDKEEINQSIFDETLVNLTGDDIQNVPERGCYNYTQLETVNLPNCNKVNSHAFYGCTDLVEVDVPNCASLGSAAFQYCPALKKVSSAATSVGNELFRRGCGSMSAFILRNTEQVASLANTAVFNTTPIASGTGYIYVPNDLVLSYMNDATWSTYKDQFRGLFNKEEIVQGVIDEIIVDLSDDDIDIVPRCGFRNYTPIETVNMKNCTSIGDWAFNGCDNLTSVEFPNVTNIGALAFKGCSSLQEITSDTFPKVTTLSHTNEAGNEGIFHGCTGLKSVEWDSYTGGSARNMFRDCTSLERVSFPNATEVGSAYFYNCPKLVSANFPKLTSTPQYLFTGCRALTDVNLPNVTVIESATFQQCNSLKYLDLPKVVAIRKANTFSGVNLICLILRSETICTIDADTKLSMSSGYIYVPRALLEDYKVATNWSDFADRFRALEDYTVDGTITGELDETKI